ncbi:MAG: hypothetical protein IPH18_17630 [Chitinophagaceae bacterium]|nr:hypothetical protein [Chitinophagaceae bacterium]
MLKKLLIYFLILICNFALPEQLHAQKPVTDTYTDVSSIKLVRPLSKLVSTCFVPEEKDPIRDYKSLKFEDDIIYHGPVPGNILQKTLLLRFNITNSRDTAIKILYFPGYFYTDIELYRVNGDTLIPQKQPVQPGQMVLVSENFP